METGVTWLRYRQVCCSGVSPAGCSIVPETRRESHLSPVGSLRFRALRHVRSNRGVAWSNWVLHLNRLDKKNNDT